MAGTNYHMEALRKQRVLERKSEAMKKLQETMGQVGYCSVEIRQLICMNVIPCDDWEIF